MIFLNICKCTYILWTVSRTILGNERNKEDTAKADLRMNGDGYTQKNCISLQRDKLEDMDWALQMDSVFGQQKDDTIDLQCIQIHTNTRSCMEMTIYSLLLGCNL